MKFLYEAFCPLCLTILLTIYLIGELINIVDNLFLSSLFKFMQRLCTPRKEQNREMSHLKRKCHHMLRGSN